MDYCKQVIWGTGRSHYSCPNQAEINGLCRQHYPETVVAENKLLRGALEILIAAACAVAIPLDSERSVLQRAVNVARAALAELGEGDS